VRPNREDLRYTVSGPVDPPVPVSAGEAFATIGPYDSIPHLHFGIHPGVEVPPSPWGRMPLDQWPETNGFVDPLDWITTRIPFSPLDPTSSIMLTCTAPGDDGKVGTASEYDIRYSTSEITEANWDSANQCTGEPAPQTAGSSEIFIATGLSPDSTYYFALKTADEVPNWSGLSNVAQGATLAQFKPELSIPVYAPYGIDAHKGTELTYTIKVTNEGDLTDTIVLSPSDTRGWDIQLSETSVTLAPGESTKVYLYLTIEEYAASNRITITGTSQGDTSKTASCTVTASGIGEGHGLFAATLHFRNKDVQDHTLTLNVPEYVKISDETFTLNPGGVDKRVNVVFDPKSPESGISTIYIDVTDITSGESESIPITFESYEIIATSFDMATDSYSFRNWGIELEIADFVLTGNCYGMSETSILYFRRIIERPNNKQNTYMLEKDEAKWKIRLHQWRGNMFLSSLAIPSADKEEEYKSLEEHIENGIPMLLNMQETIPWGKDDRHTVVAYKIIKKGDNAHIFLYENEQLYDMSQLNFYDALPYATYNLTSTDFYYRGFTQFLVSDAESYPFEQIILVVNCPVNVTITDQYDRIISDDGTNEIPDAIIIAANEEKLFYLPTELTYHIDFNANDAGKFTTTEVSPISDNTATISVFDNILITENTHATLDVVPNEENPMYIDYDGDGTIDEEKYPDVNETIEINQPPNASFTYSPAHPVVNETIVFNASKSKDPDGNITNYKWEFGNGNITDTTEPIINQTYAVAAEYIVNLTVTDNNGSTNSTSQLIKVTLKVPPEITAYAPESAINDSQGATRTFSITIDQTVNVSWQINGTEVQTNESVTEASYTNLSAVVGTWNVSVIVHADMGVDSRTITLFHSNSSIWHAIT
jgi:PKD repeat protein